VFGDLDSHDSFCRFVARRCDLPVLAVDYRLAPEHPFPAFADDAETVARWAATQPAALGRALTGLVTCGDSAGGHMSILVAQRLGAMPADLPVLAQWAIYPFVGAGRDWPSVRELGDGYMLTQSAMDWFDALCAAPSLDERYNLLRGPIPQPRWRSRCRALTLARFRAPLCRPGAGSGAKVVQLEAEGMIHGFVNMRGALPSAQQDVEAILAAGLALLP
jgi:acetyl esterase